jgi:two-component system sensor kinase FixL
MLQFQAAGDDIMDDVERRDWTIWLQEQRQIVLNIIFSIVLVLGFLAILLEAYQEFRNQRLLFNLFYYSATYIGLIILFIFRKKIPDYWQSIGLLFLIYSFGFLALRTGWLSSGGRVFMLAFVVMSAVLIHPRTSIIAAIISLLTYGIYAVAFNQQWIALRKLPDPTSASPVIIEGLGFAIVIVVVSIGLWYFGRALMAADRASQEARQAQAQVDAHARQLEAANAIIASQAATNLKDSEEKLRNVIQGASDAIIICNERGIITDWNKAAELITGIKSQKAVGQPLWKIQTQMMARGERQARLLDQLRAMLKPALASGKSTIFTRLIEGEIYHKDGTRRYIQQLAFPIKTTRGYMMGTVIRDISYRRQIELEREEMIKMLEAKNAELERFTYTVSHDLKSPLITIKGFLGYIEKDALSGNHTRLTEDVQRINNAVEKMQRLLNELLELSRIGGLINPPEELQLGSVIQEAVTLMEGSLREQGITIQVDSGLPRVCGDKTRLVEVFQNLLENAAKNMGDQAHPGIHIGSRQETNETVFFVTDNGTGIEPQYHEKIFGLFNKLNPASDGTGVGLALVKRIIEVHGGRIWVESEGKGTGSTFCFTLPPCAESSSKDKPDHER